MPRIPRPLRLDRRHRAGRQTELGRERGASYLDFTHGIDRQLDRILARHRIRAVRVVEHQRALITARAADIEQPVGPSNDAGNERECVLKPFARKRRRLHHARRDPLDASSDWTAVDRVLAAVHGDFLVKGIDVEAQGNIRGFTRPHGHRLDGRFETLQFSDDRTVADRSVRKSELAGLGRDIDAWFHAGAGERQRHARHHHRLAIWRRQRHRAGNDARR